VSIGSAPEVGVSFSVWRDMNDESRKAWFRYMNEHWSENLLEGYAKIIHLPREQNP
jgi:hypothetical protein